MAEPKTRINRKQLVLDAALELFARKGFDGTTIPEIAVAAGVAIGTIYRTAESKEALANALYADWKARFNAQVTAPVPPQASPRAALRLYWRRMAGFARANPIAFAFLEIQSHATYLSLQNRQLDQSFSALVAAFVQWGRSEGALKLLAPALVEALMRGALIGLRKSSNETNPVSAELVDEMEDCLWQAIASRN